jgi:hypothetical protein
MIKAYCLSTSDNRNQNDNKYQSNAFERIFYFEYVNSLSHIQVSKQAYNFQDRVYCGREIATRQNQHKGQQCAKRDLTAKQLKTGGCAIKQEQCAIAKLLIDC